MKRHLVPLVTVVCLGVSGVSLGQQAHPNVATGARSESLYVDSGSDQVNVFNGNLSYTIPIGEPLAVGPKLKLAPALVYNSQIWKKFQIDEAYYTRPPSDEIAHTYTPVDALAGDRTFGLGWQLHFGRLIGTPGGLISLSAVPAGASGAFDGSAALPSVPAAATQLPYVGMWPTGFAFQSPDGGVHEFFDRLVESTVDIGTGTWPCANYLTHGGGHCFGYTHDGSFLRLDPMDPDFGLQPVVYFPDGTRYVLGYRGGRWVDEFDDVRVRAGDRTCLDYAVVRTTMTWPGGTVINGPWNTTQMLDPYGNAIDIAYFGQGGTTPDGALVPPHPRAADPQAERDAIPYRAWDRAFPDLRYVEFVLAPTGVPPRIHFITVPTSSSDGGGGWRRAWYELLYSDLYTGTDVPSVTVSVLQKVRLPEPASDPLGFTFGYGSLGALTSILLPTGGTKQYDYAYQTFFTGQLEICQPRGVPCNPFTRSYSWGVRQKREIRQVVAGASSADEIAATDWVRSYKEGGECTTGADPQYCQLRVDVWSPTDRSGARRISRSWFHESNGAAYQAVYGRPMWTAEYMISDAANLNPHPGHINPIAPVRTTYFTYDFDGAYDWDPAAGRLRSLGSGFEHNTRTLKTKVEWYDPNPSNRRYHETDHANPANGASSWVNTNGQWGWTVAREFTPGLGVTTLKSTNETFQDIVGSSPARWILGLLWMSTVSRPASALDPSPANIASTTSYEYNATNGFRTKETVASNAPDAGWTLQHKWTLGTQDDPPCLANGLAAKVCSNLGFPTSQEDKLTQVDKKGVVIFQSTLSRSFYYEYGVLAAARDNVNFYAEDRDIGPTGKVIGERGTNGRTSPTDKQIDALTTHFDYDLLGRVVGIRRPEENEEVVTYSPQRVARVRRDTSNSELSRRETDFDQFGRLIRERVRMPDAWSCRLTTYDAAGYKVGLTEWWKDGSPGAGTACSDVSDRQATLDGTTVVTSSPAGTTWYGYDALGRPTHSRLADGSVTVDEFTGWWRQSTTRTLVASQDPNAAVTTTTVFERNALDQVVAVIEPATKKADGSNMNEEERTSYVYDHMGRLIAARKPVDALNNPRSDTQTRTRRYNDFGWLVSQNDPESYLSVSQWDARGNRKSFTDGVVQILQTYDDAGRLKTSESANESSSWSYNGTGVKWFEVFNYDSMPGFEFGRSNGKLVWSLRSNHLISNRGTVDFGWMGVSSLFHYNGIGGRLGFRQQTDVLMPEAPLTSPSFVASLGTDKKSPIVTAFRQYFEKQDRAAKSMKDVQKGAASATASYALALGSPSTPSGAARWSYTWNSLGELDTVTYPRRDEGYATTAKYSYNAGFLTSIQADFRDPFSSGLVGTVIGDLTYDAAGKVADTSLKTEANGSSIFRVGVDRGVDGLPRPKTWTFYKRGDQPPAHHELRIYDYDPLGNITGISSDNGYPWSYVYDARSRLIQDTRFSANPVTVNRDYDGQGNLVMAGGYLFPTNVLTNRLTSWVTYDNAGRVTDDTVANVGRDYYPDGAVISEFKHAPGSNDTLPGTNAGVSLWLVDGRGENELSFWGDNQRCDTAYYRSLVRDESAKLLTEYRAEIPQGCECGSPDPACVWRDRYLTDVVRLGPWAKASYTRGSGIQLEALDHLGTPRWKVGLTSTTPSAIVLDSFGAQISGVGSGRELFTGHERNHITGDGNGLAVTDYMHARSYMPTLGRFTRPDPADSFSLTDPQTFNRYAYARNNPLRYVDPDGRSPWDKISGFVNAFGSNALLGLLRSNDGNADYRAGQQAGDRLSFGLAAQGMLTGGSAAAGGVALSVASDGTLGPVMLPAAAEGMALATYSAGVALTAGAHLMQSSGNGGGGVQTTSKTLYNQNGVRVDVENPNPGQRPGQVHVQVDGKKYIFDTKTQQFSNAPNAVNDLLKDEKFRKAVQKGVEVYLGQ